MPSDAAYMREYRQRRRARAIALLGGACVECGSADSLEIDHRDPVQKSFPLSGFHRAWVDILEELRGCQLLCGACHQDKTSAENGAMFRKGCGSVAQYTRGCRCHACTTEMREARRRWNVSYRGRP